MRRGGKTEGEEQTMKARTRATAATKKKGALDWVQAQLDGDPTLRQEVEALVDEISIEQDLIALREARGLSQRQLARVAGVAQPMIARIESGKVSNFEIKTLVRLAAALGAHVKITLQTAKARTKPRVAVLGRATAAKRVAAGAGGSRPGFVPPLSF